MKDELAKLKTAGDGTRSMARSICGAGFFEEARISVSRVMTSRQGAVDKGPAMHDEWSSQVEDFIKHSGFLDHGGIVTDLDGTAVYEENGRVAIHPDVAVALKRLNDRGHPVVINTLRFPVNIIKTFGRAWASITDAPLPVVSLNGSMIGYLEDRGPDDPVFKEIETTVLPEAGKVTLLQNMEELVEAGLRNVLIFYYSRDWRRGETIWTPSPENLPHIRAKYKSASECFSSSIADLRLRLDEAEICLIFVLIDEPGDKLMAYQHAKPRSFITADGVNKSNGWKQLCAKLDLDPFSCVGAGDTPMDTFLSDVGLALHVGPLDLEYRGRFGTVRLQGPHSLGAFLSHLTGYGSHV